MNDRGDELSTADLAGQQPGEPAGPEHGATIADGAAADDRGGPDRPPADRTDQGDTAAAAPAASGAADYAGPADDAGRSGGLPPGGVGDRVAGGTPGGGVGERVAGGMPGVGNRVAGGTAGGGVADRGAAGGPVGERPGAAPAAGATGPQHEAGPLLSGADSEGFRARWTDVQAGFVDAPRQAVERADGLVAELMQHLATTFADERNRLENQWDRGDDVPTDDLRTAFQRYRSFFERLLAT